MPRINNYNFYKNAIEKHGESAKGLNWYDEHSQIKRFEVIYELLQNDISCRDTIIDAGCGFGDFYTFISKLRDINYIGYEILPESIQIAKKRTLSSIYYKDILSDPLEVAEFYIASGSLNILTRFETFLFIERCFNHSTKGFIFNLPLGHDESDNFNYFLPHDIKEFVKKFDCEVIIRTGYLPNDFTIYLK